MNQLLVLHGQTKESGYTRLNSLIKSQNISTKCIQLVSRQCCKAAISTGIVEVACPQVVQLHYMSAAMSMTDMYAMAADHDKEPGAIVGHLTHKIPCWMSPVT